MLEIKKLEKSEIEITGEIPAEEFSKFWGKAIIELSKRASIPGFRPGKIPEKILIDKVGENAVLDKAAELALGDIYPRIVKEKKLEVISPPHVTITKIAKNAPLGFKFRTVVLPEVKLPEDYKEIATKISQTQEEITVSDKEVDDSIEYLRRINDKFAKSMGKFETVNDLKEMIKKNIQIEKEAKNKEKKRIEIMDSIIKKSEVEIPEVLMEGEKKKMLFELKSSIENMGLNWDDYLKHVKKGEEEILSGWKEDALRRVKYGLLLEQLTKELEIKVSEDELTAKIKELGLDTKMGASGGIDKGRIKGYTFGIIRNDKIFEILC